MRAHLLRTVHRRVVGYQRVHYHVLSKYSVGCKTQHCGLHCSLCKKQISSRQQEKERGMEIRMQESVIVLLKNSGFLFLMSLVGMWTTRLARSVVRR